jgi:hypothetical protein
MKANRTHTPPPKIEDLGDGTFYYNFNIVESVVTPEEGEDYMNYDYEQVRCHYPLDEVEIHTNVDAEGYDHTINLD